MIYKFTSKACADLIMLDPAAEQVLRIIGQAPDQQGIIQLDAMPAALEALETAIAREDSPVDASNLDEDQPFDGPIRLRSSVSLRQRAWPFMAMLKQARHDQQVIVWHT